jgi:hypothetical protein
MAATNRMNACPICGQRFKRGWLGIDAHWKSPNVGHESVMPYAEAARRYGFSKSPDRPRASSGPFHPPDTLPGLPDHATYQRWLNRKARAHLKRDRGRGNKQSNFSEYREAIHKAVIESGGRDAYTGETLDWSLISTYDNEASKRDKRRYKATLAMLPTVDHRGDGTGPADFAICSWRTNDAKNDLPYEEFVRLCRQVVEYAERQTR